MWKRETQRNAADTTFAASLNRDRDRSHWNNTRRSLAPINCDRRITTTDRRCIFHKYSNVCTNHRSVFSACTGASNGAGQVRR